MKKQTKKLGVHITSDENTWMLNGKIDESKRYNVYICTDFGNCSVGSLTKEQMLDLSQKLIAFANR